MNLKSIAALALAEDAAANRGGAAPSAPANPDFESKHPRGNSANKGQFRKSEKTLAKLDEADAIQGNESKQYANGGTDDDDAAYMDAVNRGDTQDAAQMVQDAFSKRMGKVSPYVKESDSEKPRFFSRPSKPNRLGWCDAWTQLDDLAPDGDSVFFNLKNVWGPADGYQGEPYTEDMLEYAAKNFCDTMEKAGVNLNSANIIANFPRVAIEDFNLQTLIDEVGNEQFEKAMRKLGYDGFAALVDDRKVTAFDKSAIVPAAPVERDSDGNVIPLSKRVEVAFGKEIAKDTAPIFNPAAFLTYLAGKKKE